MHSVFSLQALNRVVSSSCGTFSWSTGSTYSDVTNLSCAITVSGNRPVGIYFIPDGSGSSASAVWTDTNGNNGTNLQWKILRGASIVGYGIFFPHGAIAGGVTYKYGGTPSNLFVLDRPTSQGTYTYKLQVKSDSAAIIHVDYIKLVAQELLY